MNKLLLAALGVVVMISMADGAYAGAKIKVGIFSQNQRADTALKEIIRTLEEKGMETGTFNSQDVSAGKIYDYDVLFFGGGWNGYDWLTLQGRMHLVEFVQQRGGGVIFSMFRCGCAAKSSIRPIFPEIAQAYNKSNGPEIIMADTNHPIAKGLPKEFATPFWDHAVLRLGPEGEIIALDSNDDISIACGKVGQGRVVFIGSWIGIDNDGKPCYPLPPNDEKLFLNSIGWVASSVKRPTTNVQISAEVKMKVLRRERTWDWTHDERGFDSRPGLLASQMFEEKALLDDLLYRTKELIPFASPDLAKRILALQDRVYSLENHFLLIYVEKKKEKEIEISKMGLKELEQKPEWNGTFLFPHQIEPLQAQVEELERILSPAIANAQEKKIENEKKEDLRNIPDLIKELSSGDKHARAEALLELGRIGDKRAVPCMIMALNDREYEIRKKAIYGLSWMQARKAVPHLLRMGKETKDRLTKRRIVQALGMIGDAKAEDFLIEQLEDKDRHTRQNAILSLGWLKSKKATPYLCKMAEKEDTDREERVCLVRALGHIGDQSIIPCIRRVSESYYEPPTADSAGYHNFMIIPLACEMAIKEIEDGGRKQVGISQEEFLREKENFYWLTGRYNAFYGRFFLYGAIDKNLNDTQRMQILRYARFAGITGFIEFNHVLRKHKYTPWFPALEEEYLPRFSQYNLKYLPQWRRRGTIIFDKAGFEYDIFKQGKYPCLGGFWDEESLGWAGSGITGRIKSDTMFHDDKDFQGYLSRKYNQAELSRFGIKEINAVKIPPLDDEGRKEKFLFAEYMEFVAEGGTAEYQEAAEWLRQLRMGTELLYSLSSRYDGGNSTYISGYPNVARLIGSGGPQSYECHSAQNNFDLEMHLDGEARPVIGEWYAHMTDGNARVERGFASSLLHGQCFFEMNWQQIAQRPWRDMKAWEKGRSEAAERQFQKGRAISDYLVNAESPKIIALLYSGRTTTLTYGKGSPDEMPQGRRNRYTQDQEGLWETLIQLHLPVDILWLETLTEEKMGRYKVAILSGARSLSSGEERLLKGWVENGGILISSGGASLHDQWDISLANYALSDVFGLDYVKTEMQAKDEFWRFVERDIKPEKVDKIKLIDEEYKKHAQGKETAEYEQAVGYDVIKPTKGKTVAAWEDGSPAIVENKYGQGLSIFLSPSYPGLSHKTIGWTAAPLYLEFWDGTKELIGAAVKRGLEFAHARLPIEAMNCPHYVEAALRVQEKQKRAMVHLFNIDSKVNLVKDVEVKVILPGKSIKAIYYPYPARQELKCTVAGDTVRFKVRPLDIHEVAVIEYE
ncbi:MAG: HEAT repeat domain-containing protein [Kiritimatiellae bacterium]|nr:HEAT repeat domain-containing protein [Kiritimatiellia bacterium]